VDHGDQEVLERMKQQEPSRDPDRLSRRSLLGTGVKAGIGMAGIGLGLNACSPDPKSPLGPTPTSAAEAAPPPSTTGPTARSSRPDRGVVRTEPKVPVNHTSYVTRPDLTPPGVSVKTASPFPISAIKHTYILCAPKSPLAANPGALPPGRHSFPAGATPGLMILDTAGELIWFKPLPGEHRIPFNFRVQTYKGKPTLTWFEGTVRGGHAIGGHYVLADDTYREITEVTATRYPCDLHEFILTPEGTALHTAYQPGVISDDGVSLVVGHALEVDVATNDLLFDWPCYPAVSPELSYTHSYGDYFHINSIDLWPGPARNLLISSRNTSTVYLVDRQTKQVIWRLGGKQSDFVMGPDTRFYFQHDARPLADGSGISVFDDASQPCPEKTASGKVLTLRHRTRGVTLKHRYFHTDGELDTPSQGNCQLLPDTGHVVGWGYLPFFSAYGPSGDAVEAPLILDGRFPQGAASYRTFLFDWTGHPPEHELRLVVHADAGTGNFTAWVSWNGATEIARWELRAGPSAHSLQTVSTVPKRGFETAIHFTRDGATVFEATALDASGRVIGRSPRLPTS
jgi:Arylsulfotransferase (ASST)